MTLRQYPGYLPDVEFRSCPTDKLVVATMTAIASIAMVVIVATTNQDGFVRWWLLAAAGFVGLLSAIAAIAYRKSRRSTNWLLRSSGTRQWIKFRTFLNDHLPDDAPQVVEFCRDEIAWVRPVTTKVTYTHHGTGDGAATCHVTIRSLEIRLTHAGTDELDEHLRRAEPYGAGVVGRRKFAFLGYPVSVPEPGVLRLTWSDPQGRVRPGVDAAVAFFARWTRTRPAERTSVDCRTVALAALRERELRVRLRELARIDAIAAADAVRQMRKCSLPEAHAYLRTT